MQSDRSFSRVGTLLHNNNDSPLASAKHSKANQFVPVWNQEVTDEQGRKRLHGAFKGGWSAGYFNSVGSKEGWQPSSYESSRSNRNQLQRRPEDYMDEEDLEDAIDGKELRARPTAEPQHDPLKLSATHASKKYLLIKRLGYPSNLIPPPSAAPARIIPPSNPNFNGLGFIQALSESVPRSIIVNRAASKPKSVRRGGIGVGVLNEDDDDVDVYSDDERANLVLPVLQKLKYRPEQLDPTDPSRVDDGLDPPSANPMSHFIRHSHNLVLKLPTSTHLQVPESWTPSPPITFLPSAQTPPFLFPPPGVAFPPKIPLPPGVPPFKDMDMFNHYKNMPQFPSGPIPPFASPPPGLLGSPFVPPPHSKHGTPIFPFVPLSHGKHDIPTFPFSPPSHESPPISSCSTAEPRLISKEIAKAVLNAPNKPFSGEKRVKFLAYCQYCAGDDSSVTSPQIAAAERSEFACVASLFRPMASMLEARFTRGQVQVGDTEIDPLSNTPLSQPRAKEEQRVRKSAAQAGMFGALTREVTEFRPNRLLCKRFKVPVPENQTGQDEHVPKGGTDVSGKRAVDRHLNEATMRAIIEGAIGSNPMAQGRPVHPIHIKEDNGNDGTDELPSITRPPQEVFDKIFGDAVEQLARLNMEIAWSNTEPALGEDMPVFVRDGGDPSSNDVDESVVAQLLGRGQLVEEGNIGVDQAHGKVDTKVAVGEYERVDERDLSMQVLQTKTFRPRLFKRKSNPVLDSEGVDSQLGVLNGMGESGDPASVELCASGLKAKKKKKKPKVAAQGRATCLSFGDEM